MATYIYHRPTRTWFPISEALVFTHNQRDRDPITPKFAELYGERIAYITTDDQVKDDNR